MSQQTDIIKAIIASGVREVAINPNTPLTTAEAGPVAKAIADQVLPGLQHVTNTEPWYQSRVTWGAVVSIATGLLGAVGVATDWIDADQAVSVGLALGTVVGGLVTLYGRWRARQPISAPNR